MSDGQDSLFPAGKPVAPLRPLTVRQQRIFGWICEQPDGVEAIELGQHLHAEARKHPETDFCEWCGRDGSRAIKEKAIRARLVKRGAVYEPRDHKDWTGKPQVASGQLEALPGESFEDIFGDAA